MINLQSLPHSTVADCTVIIFICVNGIYSVKPKKATRICTIFILFYFILFFMK
ncbi:hypothetical protein AO382_0674 [Moraxella catarrhalis]|uniref:Uncharacterized protein n=1 Tax=Moraxella catarrhalis TaxID=480 RepID=A0A7Z1A4D5_MORCA|nr:hypothetical protein AO382_0674 [Moraxella catarrhalis]